MTVYFTYVNTASAPTLNVNNTGAITIRSANGLAGTLTYRWYPYQPVDFINNGTYWLLQQPVVATTTYYGVSNVESATLNGSAAATPSWYAPTVSGSGSGYFLQSTSGGTPTWNLYTAVKLFSNFASSGVNATGRGGFRIKYNTSYDIAINYGAFTAASSSSTNTYRNFYIAYAATPFVMCVTNDSSDTQTQRVAVTTVNTTGFYTYSDGTYPGRWIAIGQATAT